MYKGAFAGAMVLLALSFAAVVAAQREQDAEGRPNQPSTQGVSPGLKKKAILVDASRVSTDGAMKGAAKQKTKAGDPGKDAPSRSEDSAVTELRPVPPDQEPKRPEAAGSDATKESKSGPLKGTHGTVYGGAGTGIQRTGAAAGSSTSSGRTSVFVETQRDSDKYPRR